MERPGSFERHRAGFVCDQSPFEGEGGRRQVPACGDDEAAAASAHSDAPRNLRSRGLLLESSDQLLGSVEVADGERSLDRVALDAPDCGLAETDLFDQRQCTGKVRVGVGMLLGGELDHPERTKVEHVDDRFASIGCAGGCAYCFQPAEVCVEICLPVDGDVRATELIADRGQPLGDLFGARPVAVPELENQPVEQDVDEGGLVAFLVGCVFSLGKLQPCAVELVDVAQPLAELERHPVVDCRRLRRCLELERPLRSLPVEAVTREQIRAHEACERERADSRVGAQALERLNRVACG